MNDEIVVLQDGDVIAHRVAEWLLKQALAKRADSRDWHRPKACNAPN